MIAIPLSCYAKLQQSPEWKPPMVRNQPTSKRRLFLQTKRSNNRKNTEQISYGKEQQARAITCNMQKIHFLKAIMQ